MKTSEDIAAKLSNQVISLVDEDIKTNHIEISDAQKPLNFNFNQSRVSMKNAHQEQAQLHSILRKKQLLQEQLERVKYDEAKAKEKRIVPMTESEEGKTKYFRSSLPPEEKEKLQAIIKNTRKFEEQAINKTKKLLQKISKLEEEERQERIKREQELTEEKRRQIQKKLEEIQSRKLSRAEKIKESNKEFQKVAKSKFLHESIQQKWKIIQATAEEENGKAIERRRKDHKFNADEINFHSRRYSEIISTQKSEREAKSIKFNEKLTQYSQLSKYPHSTFFNTISEEENLRRKDQMDKMKQSQILTTKRAMYAETVKQKFKPRKFKQSPKVEVGDIRTSKSLDGLGLNKLGNQYMHQIHSNIGDSLGSSRSIAESMAKNTPEVYKYPDYLTKARREREANNPEEMSGDLRQLKSIIRKKNEDTKTRLFKAKLLVQKLDEKPATNSKNLIESIAAKISIIEEFSKQRNS